MSDFSAAAVPVKSSSVSNANLYSNNNSTLSLQEEKKKSTANGSQNSTTGYPVIQEELAYHLTDNDDLMLIKSTCLKELSKHY